MRRGGRYHSGNNNIDSRRPCCRSRNTTPSVATTPVHDPVPRRGLMRGTRNYDATRRRCDDNTSITGLGVANARKTNTDRCRDMRSAERSVAESAAKQGGASWIKKLTFLFFFFCTEKNKTKNLTRREHRGEWHWTIRTFQERGS